MMSRPDKVDALHREFDAARLAGMTYLEAVRIFTALWVEARALGWDGSDDWRSDVEPDLAVARAINDRPPTA